MRSYFYNPSKFMRTISYCALLVVSLWWVSTPALAQSVTYAGPKNIIKGTPIGF